MTKIDHTKLKARPEAEDFYHKYTEEGDGKIGAMLLDNYFKAVQQLINKADLQDSATALEVGCGAGFSTKRLREMLPDNIKLEASEYVAEMLPDARRMNPQVEFSDESVYALKRADDSVDMVFLLEVLEHLDHPDVALKELSRVVKPGGYLILGVPREPLWRVLNMSRLKYVKDWGNTVGHLNHWSKRSLIAQVESGFHEVVDVRSPLPWTIVLAKKTISNE